MAFPATSVQEKINKNLFAQIIFDVIWGLRGTEEAFLLPPSSPRFEARLRRYYFLFENLSLYFLVCEQY